MSKLNSHTVTKLALVALVSITQPAAAGFGDLLKQIEQKLPLSSPNQEPASTTQSNTQLDPSTLKTGLKDALRLGSERAVAQLANTDGFLANPKVHIPLPAALEQASALLNRFGLSTLSEQLEVSMNRAAEQAAPAAATHLKNALEALSIEDAQQIFAGPSDAATRYFENHSRQRIGNDFTPIIRTAMEQVGVTRYYQQLVIEAKRYPLVGNLNLDLEQHVTQYALDGLFTTLAEQEALIRQDPVARTTSVLKQVFGTD